LTADGLGIRRQAESKSDGEVGDDGSKPRAPFAEKAQTPSGKIPIIAHAFDAMQMANVWRLLFRRHRQL
jgi:hypothetical protein